ncbi:TRAP transporter TatT component family protein [Desulfopila sp. IMCC35008]|uniref:TRAP transporter TatT component family protein n=1 Tax=Desulfopila sp. IMCC35008 TaxID=2653858 RepID=UPI0013D2241E|nr:TRAP transporter TatT component family protein [Desulfopila sp. IMCC35008]
MKQILRRLCPSRTKGYLLAAGCLLLLSSCSALLSTTFIEPTVANLQKQADLELVCEGSPSYLLMIDSMIASDPKSKSLLIAGSQAYSGYIGAMGECGYPKERIQTVSKKANEYGAALLARTIHLQKVTGIDQLEDRLSQLNRSDVPPLFWGALAVLNWIQQQQGAPAAMAELVTVEKVMARLLELDETYQAGAPHLFFGGYYATRPPMFGGDPDKSREHFEKALAISGRQFLLIQVTYAETLARQLFDKKLHDALLREVLDFSLQSAPEYNLSNQIAKRKAKRLLEDDYFSE